MLLKPGYGACETALPTVPGMAWLTSWKPWRWWLWPPEVPTSIAQFGGQLALDVEQVLHGVGGVVVRLHGIGEGERDVRGGAAAAGNGVAVEQIRVCPCSK